MEIEHTTIITFTVSLHHDRIEFCKVLNNINFIQYGDRRGVDSQGMIIKRRLWVHTMHQKIRQNVGNGVI